MAVGSTGAPGTRPGLTQWGVRWSPRLGPGCFRAPAGRPEGTILAPAPVGSMIAPEPPLPVLRPDEPKALHQRVRSTTNRKRCIFVVVELQQVRQAFPQHAFYIVGSAVSQLDPDDLGRWTTKEAELMEVLILGNDGEALRSRVLPDRMIGCFLKTDTAHVFRVGKCVSQTPDQLVREIVVEQQLHEVPNDTSRRSRSAANARQARMSSRVKSGKSSKTSCSDMPEARVVQYIVHGDSHSADAGFPTTFSRFNGDSALIVHAPLPPMDRLPFLVRWHPGQG